MNIVDLFVLILALYFVYQGYQTGLIGGLLNLFATIISFVIATLFYQNVATFLTGHFNWGVNLAAVGGFLLTLLVSEVILNLVFGLFYRQIRFIFQKIKFISKLDHYLGIFPSTLGGLFLVSLLMLFTLILPVQAWLRNPIQDSWWGKNVVNKGLVYAPEVEKFLTKLPYKNLVYILTPASSADEGSITLNLPKNLTLTTDYSSEQEMFSLVNQERASRGIATLVWSAKLAEVGRKHCVDMFKRSYFSHYTPEGLSPFDRMDRAGIAYTSAGENLAYAPSVTIAHQGLMNSPGHRENILRTSFGHLGVGVIDAGLSGKMFCQEFTN